MDDRGGNGSWLAADPLSQNENYLGQRLVYQRAGEVETALVDSVSGQEARRVLLRAFLGSFVIGWLATGAGVFVDFLAFGTPSLFTGLGVLVSIAWFVLALALPRSEILSDWHLLLDGKAAIADTAYGVVYRALWQDHAIPATIQPRRMRVGPPVRGIRNLLRVEIGKYHAYISVFPFGHDLYLGWTLWRRQVPAVIVLRWFASFTAHDLGFSGMVEMEPIKAMREAVHNALRRGIEAAIIGRQISIVETFGYEVPIETPEDSEPAEFAPPMPTEQPRMITLIDRVEVFAVDTLQPLGYADAGINYEVVSFDNPSGIVVRDHTGALALVKDRSAVQQR